MIVKVVVIEDDQAFLNRLVVFLHELDDVEVIGVATSIIEGVELLNNCDPTLVLMDVELKDGQAFEILSELDDISFDVIFITSHEHYAIKAIKFSAIDYLLKPFSTGELSSAIERAKRVRKRSAAPASILLENLSRAQKKLRIGLHTMEAIEFVELDDIVRCQADGNYTAFHLSNGERTLVSSPIKKYEELLEESGFMRTHRSHLINLHHVKRYVKTDGGMAVMSDHSEVGVSRNIKKEFLNRLNAL